MDAVACNDAQHRVVGRPRSRAGQRDRRIEWEARVHQEIRPHGDVPGQHVQPIQLEDVLAVARAVLVAIEEVGRQIVGRVAARQRAWARRRVVEIRRRVIRFHIVQHVAAGHAPPVGQPLAGRELKPVVHPVRRVVLLNRVRMDVRRALEVGLREARLAAQRVAARGGEGDRAGPVGAVIEVAHIVVELVVLAINVHRADAEVVHHLSIDANDRLIRDVILEIRIDQRQRRNRRRVVRIVPGGAVQQIQRPVSLEDLQLVGLNRLVAVQVLPRKPQRRRRARRFEVAGRRHPEAPIPAGAGLENGLAVTSKVEGDSRHRRPVVVARL